MQVRVVTFDAGVTVPGAVQVNYLTDCLVCIRII